MSNKEVVKHELFFGGKYTGDRLLAFIRLSSTHYFQSAHDIEASQRVSVGGFFSSSLSTKLTKLSEKYSRPITFHQILALDESNVSFRTASSGRGNWLLDTGGSELQVIY